MIPSERDEPEDSLSPDQESESTVVYSPNKTETSSNMSMIQVTKKTNGSLEPSSIDSLLKQRMANCPGNKVFASLKL